MRVCLHVCMCACECACVRACVRSHLVVVVHSTGVHLRVYFVSLHIYVCVSVCVC